MRTPRELADRVSLPLALLLLFVVVGALIYYAQSPLAARSATSGAVPAAATATSTATTTSNGNGHPFQYYAATATATSR